MSSIVYVSACDCVYFLKWPLIVLSSIFLTDKRSVGDYSHFCFLCVWVGGWGGGIDLF